MLQRAASCAQLSSRSSPDIDNNQHSIRSYSRPDQLNITLVRDTIKELQAKNKCPKQNGPNTTSSHRPFDLTSGHCPQRLVVRLLSQAEVERATTNIDETIWVWNQQDQMGRGDKDTDSVERCCSKPGNCRCRVMLVPKYDAGRGERYH